jgi:N-acetylmuramoyl-L-alanine amidase
VGCFEGPDRLPGEPFDSLLTQVAVVEGRHGLEVDLRLGPGATGYSRREETSTEIALLFGSAADGLAPLDPKPARTRGEVHRVVLDPTHGGLDGGRRVGGIEEKWLTLELARTLADSLRAQGFEVFLTRNEDRPLSGEERASFANEMNGDLFLSFGIEDFGAMRTPDVRCLVHAPVEAPGRAQVVAGFRLVPWEAAQSIHGEESRSAARWVLHTASSERPLDRDADPAPLRALEGVNMPAVLVLLGPDAVDVATWRISRLHLASGLTEAVLGYAGRDRVRVERFDPFGDPRRGLTPVEHDRRSEDARRDERRQAIRDARGSRRDSRDRRVREGGR